MEFRISGAYLESCNREAICPCRWTGGVFGGRSTYGECFGVLTWRIDEGHVDGVDVDGSAVALVFRYDDDEPGSPWNGARRRGGLPPRRPAVRDRPDRHVRHPRLGRELVADEFRVADAPFAWELEGNCAYEATFDYRL